MLTGEEMWCQLFSEPGAGSDLANLSTRAERDGDVYVVNGQKIWTSLAEHAKFGILIARTNSNVAKYVGISYFIIPMNLEGIEVRPIRNMTGGAGFNEVFFTDVRVPAENLIGEENRGWGMAKTTLANERVSLSTGGGLQWGHGPSANDLVALVATAAAHRTRCCASGSSARSSKARSCATTSCSSSRPQVNKQPGSRRVAAQGARRPARQAGVQPREGPHGRVRDAQRRPVARRRVEPVGRRVPLQPRPHRRRRHQRGAPQHHLASACSACPHDIDVEQGKTWAETGGNVAARG